MEELSPAPPSGDPRLCGDDKQSGGANIYDDPDASGDDNRMRRILVVETYVHDGGGNACP